MPFERGPRGLLYLAMLVAIPVAVFAAVLSAGSQSALQTIDPSQDPTTTTTTTTQPPPVDPAVDPADYQDNTVVDAGCTPGPVDDCAAAIRSVMLFAASVFLISAVISSCEGISTNAIAFADSRRRSRCSVRQNILPS